MIEQVLSAWRSAVPIVGISTTDQPELAAQIVAAMNGKAAHVRWDCVGGIKPVNEAGVAAISAMCAKTQINPSELEKQSQNPMEAFSMMAWLGENCVVHAFNSHRFVQDAVVSQALSSLRDRYKATSRMMVLYGSQFDLPSELRNDLVLVDAPAPDDSWLIEMGGKLVRAMRSRFNEEVPDDDPRISAVSESIPALRGLGRFVAEQTMAMSLRDDGTINKDALWSLKKTAISQIRGLNLSLGGPTFDSLGGLDAAKDFIRLRMKGDEPFNLVIFTDELEKQMAGFEGDNTGVMKRMAGEFLTFMEDNGIDGMLAVGPAGSGKTAFGKAIGPEFGLPTIAMSMSAMMSSLVGSSESYQREAFKAILGIGRGRIFVVATCNKLDGLPPEIKRRFTSGTWMFALPDEQEKPMIWDIHRKAFSIPETNETPKDEGWSGAEIRNCCRQARRTGLNLMEAARRYVIPISQQDPEAINRIYGQANGRWLSAAHGGHFVAPALTEALAASVPQARKFEN